MWVDDNRLENLGKTEKLLEKSNSLTQMPFVSLSPVTLAVETNHTTCSDEPENIVSRVHHCPFVAETPPDLDLSHVTDSIEDILRLFNTEM